VSGDKRLKKDGGRKEKKLQARRRDFEQPVASAIEAPQRAQDTSNFTDEEIAGANAKEKVRGRA
jgi:hypothetical protein